MMMVSQELRKVSSTLVTETFHKARKAEPPEALVCEICGAPATLVGRELERDGSIRLVNKSGEQEEYANWKVVRRFFLCSAHERAIQCTPLVQLQAEALRYGKRLQVRGNGHDQ